MLMALSDVLQLYRDAWNEREEAKRAAGLGLILRNDAVLFHPLGRVVGARAVAHFITELHGKMPFDRLDYTTLPQQHDHGPWLRIHWGIWLTGAATPNTEGIDILELDEDSRVRQIISFSGRVMRAPAPS